MQKKIRDTLVAHGRLAVNPLTVNAGADLYEFGLSSHASVNVMLALEDEFDIEFPDEALKKSTFASILNIEQVIASLLDATRTKSLR